MGVGREMLGRNKVNNCIYISVCDWSLKLHFLVLQKIGKKKKRERKIGHKAMTEQESKINTRRYKYNFFKADCRFR